MTARFRHFLSLTMLFLCSDWVLANDVAILGADFSQDKDGTWTISVALLHEDDGWDHYADRWRVVDAEGKILGERVLLHPHDDEQPFVRSESGVKIPADLSTVYIEAHDLVHGWTPHRMAVDMTKAENGHLRVAAQQ